MFRRPRLTKKVTMMLLVLSIVFIYVHILVIQHIISMIVSYGLAVVALVATASYLQRPLELVKGHK